MKPSRGKLGRIILLYFISQPGKNGISNNQFPISNDQFLEGLKPWATLQKADGFVTQGFIPAKLELNSDCLLLFP